MSYPRLIHDTRKQNKIQRRRIAAIRVTCLSLSVRHIFRVSIAFRHVASLYPGTPWDLSWSLQPDEISGTRTIKIVAPSVATCSNFRIGANLEPLLLLDMVERLSILSHVEH